MKTWKYILGLGLLGGIFACSREAVAPEDAGDGTTVTVPFSVTVPEEGVVTKGAMGTVPEMTEMWVAVFDDAGFLAEWVRATLTATAPDRGNYEVTLLASSTPRTLHFIADPPSEPRFAGEAEVIPQMVTTSGESAYWQRVEVSRIKAGDAAMEAALQDIPLVRNFARIEVTSSTTKFTVSQYALVNGPEAGSVAPYDRARGRFATAYLSAGSGITYAQVQGSGYAGYLPLSVGIDTSEPDTFKSPGDADPYLFVYERPRPTANPTAVLVGGTWTETGAPSWYKIELMDDRGRYTPLYRNFNYRLNITDLSAPGFASAHEAFVGAAIGDVSSSLETTDLTEVSNDQSELKVSTIDWTDTQGGTVEVFFRFVPDVSDGTVDNSYVRISVQAVDGYEAAVTATEIVSLDGETYDGTSDWGKVVVTVSGEGSDVLRSIVRVEATLEEDGRPLYRDISFRMIPTPALGVDCTPLGTDAAGQEVTLTITLPTDLGRALFPLTLQIEAKNRSLSPLDGDMPVETGPSAFDDVTGNTFYFLKTITYADYYDAAAHTYTTSFQARFKTTKSSGNATTVKVSDKNGLFTAATTELQ